MHDDLTATLPSLLSPAALPKGTVLSGRFTVEAPAGRGGMGSVYRATDSLTGKNVALKLLHVAISPEVSYRFNREAVLLAELSHPAIVSYVAHGVTEQGQSFLVMEWLEGEDLAHRLAREPLRLPETLALLRRAAEGLAQAHQKGIIHRDLKPSNLLLREGRPEGVLLLDFGLARYVHSTLVKVTGSNMVIGTPGYMAPEQASSQSDITPSADIFSLGCVLYECLTGQPPFKAPHLAATLAKILYTEPAPLHTLRADLSPSLQVLVDRMLAKDPRRRLPDASHLLEALSALESVPELLSPRFSSRAAPHSLVGAEQRLVSLLLVSRRARARTGQDAEGARGPLPRESLSTALAPFGAQVALLADGSLMVTLVSARGAASDQAVLAARCALRCRELGPDVSVVLVTGPGILSERGPIGDAMDRAGRLLHQLERMPEDSVSVMLDDVTAGLLGAGFQVSRLSLDTFLLHGEQLGADALRPLLGKPTPCVGREQELASLELALTSCREEPAAQCLLVTAPPGTGKSRLRHEFLRRIEQRAEQVLLLLGRGDPMGAGASHGLLGQALLRLCGIVEGEALEARRARLAERVRLRLPAGAQDVVEFLGELCGIPFPDEDNPRLRTARHDPRVMSTHVGRALVTFLQAECAHQPVLLVLEDLHWGDALTVKLVDEALRELAESPFMVLALARPEVKELFPELWARCLQEISLRGLNRKAGERLVREVLGPAVPGELVARLLEQAAGNALFLEELIRVVAEGHQEAPPVTVLAMLQARLSRLEPELRQALLAASILGRTFWPGAVLAVMGTPSTGPSVDERLARLVEQEVVEPQPGSRFPGQLEYRFRHALVREAAYGLVPESLRPVGHQLAGAWLERVGEVDPRVLAEHARAGQQPERAIYYSTLAAEQLFERHEMRGMQRCMEAALEQAPRDEALVRLQALQATAAFWMDDFATTQELGQQVLPRLKAGGLMWSRLVGALSLVYGQLAQREAGLALYRLMRETAPEPQARSAFCEALCFMGNMADHMGLTREADACFERVQRLGRDLIERDGLLRGWWTTTQCFRAFISMAGPWAVLSWAQQAEQAFREVGAENNALASLVWAAQAMVALGDTAGAVELLRRGVVLAEQQERRFSDVYVGQHLALALAASPLPAHQQEARALALELMQGSNRVTLSLAYLVLARVEAGGGELARAEKLAREASELLASLPPFIPLAQWMVGTLVLLQGRVSEAREVAARALRQAEALGSAGVAQVGLLQVLADACFAEGDTEEGEKALRQALRCVRSRAAEITDEAARERYLRQVPENARVLELVRQRWGETLV
jgi:tetratricopeptide (TPR) repeat protein